MHNVGKEGDAMITDIIIRDGKRYVRCPRCVGSGTVWMPGAQHEWLSYYVQGHVIPCPDCNGRGEVEIP